MKVQIIGTHCTGKTTLINNIPTEFKKFIIPEQARVLADKGIVQINQGGNMMSQSIIFNQYVFYFMRDHYISDRGLIDNLAYSADILLHTTSQEDINMYFEQHDYMCKFVKYNPDVHYVYLPIQWDELENDGVRDVDVKWRRSIDNRIQEFLTEVKPQNLHMIQGNKGVMKEEFNSLLRYWWDHE